MLGNQRTFSSLLIVMVLTLSARTSVHAQATYFSSLSAFNAATTGRTTLDFTSYTVPGLGQATSYSTAAGLTIDGINFVGNVTGGGYNLYVVNPTNYFIYSGWNGNPTVLQGPTGTGTPSSAQGVLDITLPAGTTAVGTNLYTVENGAEVYGESVHILLSTGDSFTVPTFQKSDVPDLAFAGFTSTVPITSMQISMPNSGYPELSGFVFGQRLETSNVPEPSGLTALFGGLLGISGLWVRRCRNRQ